MHGHIHAIPANLSNIYSVGHVNRAADAQRASEVRKKLAARAHAVDGAVHGVHGMSEGDSRDSRGGAKGGPGERKKESADPVEPISFWA